VKEERKKIWKEGEKGELGKKPEWQKVNTKRETR
jgi:hypothetical protein